MPRLHLSGWVRIAIVIAGLYIVSQVTAVFLPLILAVIVSFILHPLVEAINRVRIWRFSKALPREMAILIAFLLLFALVAVVASLVLLPLIKEFNRFIGNVPTLLTKMQNIGLVLEQRAHDIILPDNVRTMLEQGLSNAVLYSAGLARRIVNSAISFAGGVIDLVVVPVLVFYFLRDWRQLQNGIVRAFPPGIRSKTAQIIEEMGVTVSGYIRAQVLLSLIIGTAVFCGMALLNVDYPLVLGLLAALTEFIPIIGPIIGAIPAVILSFLISPALAIKVILVYVIIQQLENNIIVPNIMQRTVDLHPVMVIIGMLAGGQLLGWVGMILAVPFMALVKVVLKHIWKYEEG
ncbi:AI-2E family transporter [Acetonema longum]|uniref:Permease n=1 Tax=Acetonema longum DSM 6540 TaxID=1009370 RepID=F7NPM7_9FIRM|nr:AI-2E family transporter [Acetonema longum]EGO61994.1 hypothetical protein ALO_20372 [Acetonema longum DSM 6540]